MIPIAPKALAKRAVLEYLFVRARFIPRIETGAILGRPVLIVSLGGIGNTLMATPMIAALRAICPESPIDLLTTPPAASLLADEPALRAVVSEESYRSKQWKGYWDVQRTVSRGGYACVLYALNLMLLKYAARGVFARVPRRVMHCYDYAACENACRLATDVFDRDGNHHDVDANVDLVRSLWDRAAEAGPLTLTLSEAARAHAAEQLLATGWDRDRPSVAVFPGGSAWQWDKWWPRERYHHLTDELLASHPRVQVFVHCGPAEKDEARAWVERFGDRIAVVQGWGLQEVAASLMSMSVTLCNDSLPVHLCSALGRPCVTLFGPTDPARTGPWRNPDATVITPDGDWTPYFKLPYPPDPRHYPAYMERISVERVYHAVIEALRPERTAPSHGGTS